jgi:hypothetical protein
LVGFDRLLSQTLSSIAPMLQSLQGALLQQQKMISGDQIENISATAQNDIKIEISGKEVAVHSEGFICFTVSPGAPDRVHIPENVAVNRRDLISRVFDN